MKNDLSVFVVPGTSLEVIGVNEHRGPDDRVIEAQFVYRGGSYSKVFKVEGADTKMANAYREYVAWTWKAPYRRREVRYFAGPIFA